MCHNYSQGVTVKTALKPDEVVFTNMNRQIEQHIGVSFPPPSLLHSHKHAHTHTHTCNTRNSLSPIPRGYSSVACHFLCVFMGVCQYGKCMQCLPHFFPLFRM